MTKVTKNSKKQASAANKTIPQTPPWLLNGFMILLILGIPFVYISETLDHTLLPRFVSLSVLVMLYLSTLLFYPKVFMPETDLLKRPPVYIWLLFAFTGVVSSFVAVNQGEAVFTILKDFLFLIFLLFISGWFLRSGKHQALFNSIAVLALANLCIGYVQYFYFAFQSINMEDLYKVKGLLSHKNVFSGFLFLMIPFMVYELFQRKKNFYFIAALIFLLLTLIFLIQTRAVWLGIAVFAFVFGISLFFLRQKLEDKQGRKSFLKVIILFFGILALSFTLSSLINDYSISHPLNLHKANAKHKLTTVEKRLESIADPSSQNIQRRLEIWKITASMINDKPLLGHGAGNWKIIVPSYYYEGYITDFYHNWRRPHNDFLWIAAERGLPAMIIYIAFFIVLIVYALKVLFLRKDFYSALFAVLMLAGLAGYTVDAMVAFPYERVSEQLMFMLMAGGIISVYHKEFPLKNTVWKLGRKTILALSFILLLLCVWVGAKIWKAEVDVNYAHAFMTAGRFNESIEYTDEAYSSLYSIDAMNVPLMWFRGNCNMKQNKLEQAILDFEMALKDSPNSIMVYTDLGAVYGQLGRHRDAIEQFQKVIKVNARNADVLKNMGVAYYHLNQLDTSLMYFTESYTHVKDTTTLLIINGLKEEIAKNKAVLLE